SHIIPFTLHRSSISTLFPYTTLFRSTRMIRDPSLFTDPPITSSFITFSTGTDSPVNIDSSKVDLPSRIVPSTGTFSPGLTSTLSLFVSSEIGTRSEEHTSELQSRFDL